LFEKREPFIAQETNWSSYLLNCHSWFLLSQILSGAINVCVAAWSRLTRYTINDFCADAFDLYDEVCVRWWCNCRLVLVFFE
jgi:hypothetical protein